MIVRLAPKFRRSLDAIRHITIGAPNPAGGVVQIPLTDVANVRLTSGAAFIYREDQERYIPVKFSVRGRDLGTAVIEAQKKIADEVLLPGGYHLEWVGEFGNLQEAIGRLDVVVPLAIVLICLLLLYQFRFAVRHAAGGERDPDGADRRHFHLVFHRYPVQCLGGDRLRGACSAFRPWMGSSC